MHVRISESTVSPARIGELSDLLSNKVLPVAIAQRGFQALLCAADRATGSCAVVSMWDSKESLDASESAIASIRSVAVEATDAQLNSIVIAEVAREIMGQPTQVGARSRVVHLLAPAGSAERMLEFYDAEAVPLLQAQPGFLNARLLRDVDHDGQFRAVSHWADAAALEASEQNSARLRDGVAEAIAGTSVEGVSTLEIILCEGA